MLCRIGLCETDSTFLSALNFVEQSGRILKGGEFAVKRTEVAPSQWELTEMMVNMEGKALLFKTISVQQKELPRNFQRVPDDLTIADAAATLLKQSLIAARR